MLPGQRLPCGNLPDRWGKIKLGVAESEGAGEGDGRRPGNTTRTFTVTLDDTYESADPMIFKEMYFILLSPRLEK